MQEIATVPVDPEPVGTTQIVGPEGEGYNLIVAEDVTLADGTMVPAGDPLYADDVVLTGAIENAGDTSVWVIGPDGEEIEISPPMTVYGPDGEELETMPGGVLKEGCMKRCSKLCPPEKHAECWAEERGGRDCCKCQCLHGAGAIYCTCEAWEPQ
jgi:hypothetical protein